MRLWDPATGTGLLSTKDLVSNDPLLGVEPAPRGTDQPVRSALNSLHLDDVARDAVGDIPAWGSQPLYDFLAADLDLFLTTTNLNGVVYKVDFKESDGFSMGQHGTPRHFRLQGMGKTAQF